MFLNFIEFVGDLTFLEGFLKIVSKLNSNSYKCICIFVDNSGFDVVLGVLPLVIEFLKYNIKVTNQI